MNYDWVVIFLSCVCRPPHGSSSATLMNRTTYSASQSPLTGAVPGSSPHSRNSTGNHSKLIKIMSHVNQIQSSSKIDKIGNINNKKKE